MVELSDPPPEVLQWRNLYYRYKADSELPLELNHPALLLRDLKTKLGEDSPVLSCDIALLLSFSQEMYRTVQLHHPPPQAQSGSGDAHLCQVAELPSGGDHLAADIT